VDPDGLHAATEVLAAVDANLGPLDGGPSGAWRLRVPTLSERPSYLMVILAGEPIALPWHSVLRIMMASPGQLAALERDPPILEMTPNPGLRAGDVPLVCVGHGRRRGWLVADRLVWRLEGTPASPPRRAPWPGLTRAVSTEEHEIYWVAEAAWLLRDVPVPPLPAFDPQETSASDEPSAAPADPSGPPPGKEPEGSPLPELTFENVHRIDRDSAPSRAAEPVATIAAPAPAPSEQAEPVAAVVAPAPAPSEQAKPVAAVVAPASAPSEQPEPVAAIAMPAPPRTPDAPRSGMPMPASTEDRRSRSRRMEDRARRGVAYDPPRERRVPRTGPPARIVMAQPSDRPLALVAEDSITARIVLTRMLEQQGLEVEAVDTAAELLLLLPQRSWALVCVDVDLPDGRGESLLRMVGEVAGKQGPSLVALVRDEEDETAARAAGVSRMLHKPFDLEALTGLLTRLGLQAGRRR
jgi:CheY-like chemotaxis protein